MDSLSLNFLARLIVFVPYGDWLTIALTRILETVVTFHFSGGKVYSMDKGCHTCMIKHTMYVQSFTVEHILPG